LLKGGAKREEPEGGAGENFEFLILNFELPYGKSGETENGGRGKYAVC
jgi:hypothetical protein